MVVQWWFDGILWDLLVNIGNHRKTIGKIGGFPWDFMVFNPLVMTNIAMENHHVFNGKFQNFYGHVQ